MYVGGLAERPPLMPGGKGRYGQRRLAMVLGETHSSVIADAFANLRKADR